MDESMAIAYSKRRWNVRHTRQGPVLETDTQVTHDGDWPWGDRSNAQVEQASTDDMMLFPITARDLDLTDVQLCSKAICSISENIGHLQSLPKRIYLCCNRIQSIPREIGYLAASLTVLSLERNNLTNIPDTIGLLANLEELRLNHNRLFQLPQSVTRLSNLRLLTLSHNAFHVIPSFLGCVESLIHLDVSANPIHYLPAELMRLPKLRRFYAYACPFLQELPTPSDLDEINRDKRVPPLMELSARTVTYYNLDTVKVPEHVNRYLEAGHKCSFCNSCYWSWLVVRYSWWERNDIDDAGRRYPVVYRLCEPHWDEEGELIPALFRTPQPVTESQKGPSVWGHFKRWIVQKKDVVEEKRRDEVTLPPLQTGFPSHFRRKLYHYQRWTSNWVLWNKHND